MLKKSNPLRKAKLRLLHFESILFSLAFAFTGACDAKVVTKPATANKQKFVSGILFDSPFQMSDAFVSSNSLLIRAAETVNRSGLTHIQLKYRQYIKLDFPQAEKLENQTFIFKSYERQMTVGDETQPAPRLSISALINNYCEVIQPTEPYTLALTFYKATNGMIPGSISLRSDDVRKINLRGYFYAKLTR